MKDIVKDFITFVNSNSSKYTYDEIRTKQELILGMLHILGWNVFNTREVEPEYGLSGRRVDYALRNENSIKCFIEVKKVCEDLEKEHHQEQLLDYSFKEGVNLAVLTNGVTWWFYLPLKEGSWDQRKFYSIDFSKQNIDDVADNLICILSKANIVSGDSLKYAENIHSSNKKLKIIKEFLPQAWKKLIEEPHDLLVELISDTTEELCGFKPEESTTIVFIQSLQNGKSDAPKDKNYKPQHDDYGAKPANKVHDKRRPNTGTYIDKALKSFTFQNHTYQIRHSKEILIKISEIVYKMFPDRFYSVASQLRGSKREWWSKTVKDKLSDLIPGTDIYVYTNLSTDGIISHSRRLLESFDFDNDDFSVESV